MNNPMLYTPYKPRYFRPEELVPPESVKDWYRFCDYNMLIALDKIRERFGSITINNYLWGGKLKYSGYRPPYCTEGEATSQHRYGRAFDLKFQTHVNLEDVIDYITTYIPAIRIIRKYDWGLHVDNRNTDKIIVWRDT